MCTAIIFIATDAGDHVEILCEVFRVCSEWRKNINISHYKDVHIDFDQVKVFRSGAPLIDKSSNL